MKIMYGVTAALAAIAIVVIGPALIITQGVSAQRSGSAADTVEHEAEKGKRMDSDMGAILFIRAKSGLGEEELNRRMLERKPGFLEVPGLVQKFYGRDAATGHVCGIYFFESKEALAKFGKSELAQTIASAYEVTEIRREAYDVLYPLRPERGPLTKFSD